MTSTVYQPQNLIKKLREMLQLKSNGALARELCVPASLISRVQRCHLPVGPALLIRMQEATSLSIADLRILMGDRRKKMRLKNQGMPDSIHARRATVETPAHDEKR